MPIATKLLKEVVEWAETEAAKPEIDRRWVQQSWITEFNQRASQFTFDYLDDIGVDSSRPGVQDLVARVYQQLEPYCSTGCCAAGYIGQKFDKQYVNRLFVNGVHVSEFAEQALGLDPIQAQRFFAARNSAADLRRLAEEFVGGML